MRSFIATALCLSLIDISSARVPHSFPDLTARGAEPGPKTNNRLSQWFGRLFKRQSSTDSTNDVCYEDAYYEFVGSLEPGFCQDYLHSPSFTVTVEYTPMR